MYTKKEMIKTFIKTIIKKFTKNGFSNFTFDLDNT